MRYRIILAIVIVLVIIMVSYQPVLAQCALCKSTAETSIKEGNNTARGLNAGIMYLLIIPYAIVAALGYWWYKRNRKIEDENV